MSRIIGAAARPLYCLLPFAHRDTIYDTLDDRRLREDNPTTGWERIQIMFSRDKYGSYSKEIISIMQITTATWLMGIFVGGFIKSQYAAQDYIERNQHTRYMSVYEAKRKAQDYVLMKFLGHGLFWGIKCAIFAAASCSMITLIGVYRGEPKIRDYAISLAVAGGFARSHLGLKAMFGGSVIGSILGTACGAIHMSALKMGRTSMDEVRQWQYDLHRRRKEAWSEVIRENHPFHKTGWKLGAHTEMVEGIKVPKEPTDVYMAVDESEPESEPAEVTGKSKPVSIGDGDPSEIAENAEVTKTDRHLLKKVIEYVKTHI